MLIGLLGTGCGSSGIARQSGSVSASASAAGKTAASEQQRTEEQADQNEQDTRTATSADPVKVLRLEKVRKRLKNAAKEWYGTPYDWGGESKQGVDCSGFVQNVYEDAFSYSLPRVTETQLQTGSKVRRDQIRPGDLVFFRPEGEYNHVGVYLGKGTFAHASSSDGVTKSQMDLNYWKKYYWTARRPLTPSSVPDKLTSELLAYRYPESDSTVAITDASEKADQKPSDSNEKGEPSNTKTSEGTKIASCEAANVECADPSTSTEETSDSQGGDARKGW